MDKKNEKVIAKILSGHDAECMYDTRKETPGTCPICNNRLEDVINMSYKIRKKRWDMYDTYDCFCIVTETFKRFCEENDYPDLTFMQITASPGYYYFTAEAAVLMMRLFVQDLFIKALTSFYKQMISFFVPITYLVLLKERTLL